MRTRFTRYLMIVFLILTFVPTTQAFAKKTVRVGLLMDDRSPKKIAFIGRLQKELKNILGSEVNVLFPEDKQLTSKWSVKIARQGYYNLVEDKKIDIVLITGILSCFALKDLKEFSKPVIAVGIIAPKLQGVIPTPLNTSGIKNLTYIMFNRSIERNLNLFHKVYPFKKVGIAGSSELLRLYSRSSKSIPSIVKKLNADFVLLPVSQSIDDVLTSLGDVDAVYLEYLGRFEETERKRLIEKLNAKGIPTFGASLKDLAQGALAAASPKESMAKVIRRIALNIESVINKEDLSTLPVGLSFEERLTINMTTARKINFSPSYEILSKAEIVNQLSDEWGPKYGLKEVMAQAVKANLDLMIKKSEIETAEKEVEVARSNYFPTLSATAGGTVIDEESAQISGGSQAERIVNGKVRLEQLIYSEEQVGSVTTLEHQLEAVEYGYRTALLDVGINAANAYINTMKAMTSVRIHLDNVDMTRKHLTIAKTKVAVGYASNSDVYRLESNMATAQTDHLASINAYKQLKIELNQIMNRPLTEEFSLKELAFNNRFQGKYINQKLKEYINNPDDLKRYTHFLVEDAIRNSPELKELNSSVSAIERRRTSLKRKRFFPVVSLGAESEYVFDRSGEGSNVSEFEPLDDTWNAGLNLTWSFYNGGATSVDIEKQSIELSRLKKQQARYRQSIEATMRSAVLNTVTKVVAMKLSGVAADYATKSLDLIRDAYAKGKASITELLDAQNTALNADLNKLNSEYDFTMAVLNVERAAGSLTILGGEANFDEHMKRIIEVMKTPQEGK